MSAPGRIAIAFSGVKALLLESLKTAVATFFFTVAGGGLFLGVLAYWLAANGIVLRGVVAGAVSMFVASILGLALALVAGATSAVMKLLRDAQLGRRLFDEFFERGLSVSDDVPEGHLGVTQQMHQMPVDEVERRLKNMAGLILDIAPTGGEFPQSLLWFAELVGRIATWATVKVIVRGCTQDGQGNRVDLLALRANLAGVIDEQIAGIVRGHAARIGLSCGTCALLVVVLVASSIARIPFAWM